MQSTHATQATHRVQRTHPSVATHARRPTPRNVRTLASTPQLPAVARLPATTTLPDVATLPARETLPTVATLPATAMLPAVATLPATATLPSVATLRATAVRSLVSAVRTTWERVAIATLIASVPACPRRIPSEHSPTGHRPRLRVVVPCRSLPAVMPIWRDRYAADTGVRLRRSPTPPRRNATLLEPAEAPSEEGRPPASASCERRLRKRWSAIPTTIGRTRPGGRQSTLGPAGHRPFPWRNGL